MLNPQDIDISQDEKMKANHNRVTNVVFVAVIIFFTLLSAEQITTIESVRAVLGTVLLLIYSLLAYWLGRADGENKK